MKFLLDVHIPYKLADFLNSTGAEAIHINTILDKWHTADHEITSYADQNDFIVVTKDADFRNSFLAENKPRKLIKINLGNITNGELIIIFQNNISKFETVSKKPPFMIEIDKHQIQVIFNEI